MFCQAGFDPWRTTIRPPLSPVSKPQATVWARWSWGMGLARSCALRAVSHLWATGTRRHAQTVRPQWRAWDDDVARQRGTNRQARRGETCVRPLGGWVVSGWQGTPRALAIAATALGPRVVVVAGSGVDRGGAMPVAWVVWPATPPQAWRRAWLRRWRRLRPALPRHWPVIVRADRGV